MIYCVLVCRTCWPAGDAPMPFTSAEARGRWASEHTRATGHDLWFVYDDELAEMPTSGQEEDQKDDQHDHRE